MTTQHSKTDVILIGGGIMSATLGTLLKELSPEKNEYATSKLKAFPCYSGNAFYVLITLSL
ncbi:malate:quinone oxidoreductase, partial [Staphylococcus aureus]|uniref:malate:quinone oxidoreductase n=1 Tax=Staphylococcus aureus TaxID=1280 RepID=UPI00210A085E